MSLKLLGIAWCLWMACLAASAQTMCERTFVERLKEAYHPKEEKFRKKTMKVCRRQLGARVRIAPEWIVPIPRLCYKENVREHKRIDADDYFCYVDPHSVQFDAALIRTPDQVYILFASPLRRRTYRVIPNNKTPSVQNLAGMIEIWRPEVIFTVTGDPEHIFFVKEEQIAVFDRLQGCMVESGETLRRLIDDPLIFRYILPDR